MARIPQSVGERLLLYVEFEFPRGCWVWTGNGNNKGYGLLTVKGKEKRAHRASYEAFIGPIPFLYEVNHICHNRGCINPAHLEAISQEEHRFIDRHRASYGGRIGGRKKRRSDLPFGLNYCNPKSFIAQVRDPKTDKWAYLGCRTPKSPEDRIRMIEELTVLVKAKCKEFGIPYDIV